MHACIRNRLSFTSFELSALLCFWISPCSGTRVPSCSLGEKQRGQEPQNRCSYGAPVFQSRRSQPKVQLSSLRNEAMLCACPVLVDPGRLNITQSVRKSKHVEILLSANFQVASKCWRMSCEWECWLCPTLPTLTSDICLTLCCFSWDVVPSLE